MKKLKVSPNKSQLVGVENKHKFQKNKTGDH